MGTKKQRSTVAGREENAWEEITSLPTKADLYNAPLELDPAWDSAARYHTTSEALTLLSNPSASGEPSKIKECYAVRALDGFRYNPNMNLVGEGNIDPLMGPFGEWWQGFLRALLESIFLELRFGEVVQDNGHAVWKHSNFSESFSVPRQILGERLLGFESEQAARRFVAYLEDNWGLPKPVQNQAWGRFQFHDGLEVCNVVLRENGLRDWIVADNENRRIFWEAIMPGKPLPGASTKPKEPSAADLLCNVLKGRNKTKRAADCLNELQTPRKPGKGRLSDSTREILINGGLGALCGPDYLEQSDRTLKRRLQKHSIALSENTIAGIRAKILGGDNPLEP